MRKTLLQASASSCICWSIGVTFLWIGRDRASWIGFSWIGFIILSIGGLLFLLTSVLFILRGILLAQAFSQRGINLKIIDLFRKNEMAKHYQRDIRVQGMVIFTLPLFVLLGLLGRLIVQANFPAPFTNPVAAQDKAYFSALVTLTIYLVFPLGMLLYALVSKDVSDILSGVDSEEPSEE